MSSRLTAIALCAGALSGCEPRLRTCAEGCLAGAICDNATQICVYLDGGAGGGSGGSAGGGSGGSGGTGGGAACPACPSSSFCSAGQCAPRYASLQLTVPSRVGGSPSTIQARLVSAPAAPPADPPALPMSLVDDAGTALAQSQLSRADAGLYLGALAPLPEGAYTLEVSYPDAGLAASRRVFSDRSAPTSASVTVVPPPPRANDGGFNASDTLGPADAYRRDETVTVWVDSPAADAVEAAVELWADGGVAWRVVADAGCATRFDGGVCRSANVELWHHPMPAYRATVGLTAVLRDDVGNSLTVDAGSVSITRHKWYLRLPQLITSLALTPSGHLVLAGNGLTSWSHEGAFRWELPIGGPGFSAGLTVGSDSADASVYVGSLGPNDTALLHRVGSDNPSSALMLTLPVSEPAVRVGKTTLRRTTADVVYVSYIFELGAGQFGERMVAFHWGDGGVSSARHLLGNRPEPQYSFGDDRIQTSIGFFSNGSSVVNEFSALPPEGFPLTQATNSNWSVTALGAPIRFGDHIYGYTDGGPQSLLVSTAGRFAPLSLPLTGPGIVVGDDAIFVNEVLPPVPGQPNLCRVNLDGGNLFCVDVESSSGASGAILGAGPAGQAPSLYIGRRTASAQHVRVVDSRSLAVLWDAPAVFQGFNLRLRGIDCGRDSSGAKRPGAPGVLYATSWVVSSTFINAIIIDSPGIDSTAKWPMETHDPRNTANTQTPLAPFHCP